MRLPDPQLSRVVLIGTSEYEDEKLPDLPAVGRSIADLTAALIDPVYGLTLAPATLTALAAVRRCPSSASLDTAVCCAGRRPLISHP